MFGFTKKKFKLGIALGGGGARGFAHLGVLQALYEKGIKPDIISGVSAGAIAGAFISSGKTPLEALELIRSFKIKDFTKLQLPKEGLLNLDKLHQTIQSEIEVKRLEDLEIPLIVGVSDMLGGKLDYLTKGSLADCIQASASIPILFKPVKINDKVYADGGLFDNLPVKPLQGNCKKIIAVNISPIQKIDSLDGLIDTAIRMFQLSVNSSRNEAMSIADEFIEPLELCNYDLMDTKHAQEIFDIGYGYTKKMNV